MGELEVGAVRTSLVPALDSSTDGTRGNGQVQDERYTPSVKDLIAQGFNLGVVKGFIASDVFITGRVLDNRRDLLCDRIHLPRLEALHEGYPREGF